MTTTPSKSRYGTVDALPAALLLGVGLVVLSYWLASRDRTTGLQYAVFWVGLLASFGFALVYLLRVEGDRNRSTLGLVLVGSLAYLPHFLRAPTRPYMNDEFGHYLATQNILRTGRLFTPDSIVFQASNFPGLETLTVGLQRITGMGTYGVGIVLIWLLHIATVMGIYQLSLTVLSRPRAALLSGLLYAVSPQFSFFDSMFAYESFGLPLAVWGLAAGAKALQHDGQKRLAWLAITALLGLDAILAHHVSSYVLIAGLLIIGSVQWLTRTAKKERAGVHWESGNEDESWAPTPWGKRAAGAQLVALAGVLTVVAAAWVAYRTAGIAKYLGANASNGFATLYDKLTGSLPSSSQTGLGSARSTRAVFGGSHIPPYEQYATYFTPPILLALAIYAAIRFRRAVRPGTVLVIVLTVLYFVSLPLIITASGQDVAHRSWAFTFIGVSVMAGLVLDDLMSRRKPRWLRRPRFTKAGVVVCAGLLLLGGYGAAVNYLVIFPGPFVFQSDGRSTPSELFGVADWIRTHEGYQQTILADHRTFVVVAALTDAMPARATDSTLFVDYPLSVGPHVEGYIRGNVDLIVLDKRLYSEAPTAYVFGPHEPDVTFPIARVRLAQLEEVPYLRVIHQTAHYIVLRVVH